MAICWTLYSSCISSTLQAQSSFKCYTEPKANPNWTIGFRTGISQEYDKHNWQWRNNNNRSWTQLLFIQRDIGKHFMLELQSLHHRSWKDLLGNTYYPGRTYSAIVTRNERLHNNLILHYLLPEVLTRLRTGAGVGLGIVSSWQKQEEVYIQSGKVTEQSTKKQYTDAPNLVFALTASYKLKDRLYISGQSAGSFLTDTQLSHLNINAGIAYRF